MFNLRETVSPPPLLPEEENVPKSSPPPTKQEETRNPGAFNISDFRSNATLQDSILPKHSFLVTFSPFTATQKASRYLNRYLTGTAAGDLVLRCDSAQLPGVTALKDEISRFGYGPVEDVAYGMQFADMTLGFIVNKEGLHYKFFNEWMSLITNYKSKGGGDMTKEVNGYKPYQVGYKDDYSNLQMNITVFDRSHNQVLVYELYDVFPIAINAMDVSWGDVDQLMRIYVRFAYTDFSLRVPQIDSKLPSDFNAGQPAGLPVNQNPNEEKQQPSATQQPAGQVAATQGATTAVNAVPEKPDTQTVPPGINTSNPNPVQVTVIAPSPPTKVDRFNEVPPNKTVTTE